MPGIRWSSVLVALVVVAGACSDEASPTAERAGAPGRPSVTDAAGDPGFTLAPAPRSLRSACVRAAEQLGYRVPCPTRVPTIQGIPATCQGTCVATAGGDDTYHELFSFEVVDFDGGDGLGEVRHLVVEAHLSDGPPMPCFAGVASGRINDATTVLSRRDRTARRGAGQDPTWGGGALWPPPCLLGPGRSPLRRQRPRNVAASRQVIDRIVGAINLVDE